MSDLRSVRQGSDGKCHSGILPLMRTIQLTVPESDYQALQRAADAADRPVEQLILEALEFFRRERIEARTPLRDLPILPGHRLVADLPSRGELYEEVFSDKGPTKLWRPPLKTMNRHEGF